MDVKCLPVSVNLPAGYLSVQPFGLGKGVSFYFYTVSYILILNIYMYMNVIFIIRGCHTKT